MCYDCVCVHVLALCPASPHTRQRRCRGLFAGGSGDGNDSGSGEDSGDDGVDVAVSTGTGQTISCVSSEQYGLILWYRYCCRSRDRPGGGIVAGRSSGDGAQLPRSNVKLIA